MRAGLRASVLRIFCSPPSLCRKMDLHSVWRYLNAEALDNQVVYDLQSELQSEADGCEGEGEAPPGADPEAGCLKFDARFESGNLMRAVRVSCVRSVCVYVHTA